MCLPRGAKCVPSDRVQLGDDGDTLDEYPLFARSCARSSFHGSADTTPPLHDGDSIPRPRTCWQDHRKRLLERARASELVDASGKLGKASKQILQ